MLLGWISTQGKSTVSAKSRARVVLPELDGPKRAKDWSAQQWFLRPHAAKAARLRHCLARRFPTKRDSGQRGLSGSVNRRRNSGDGIFHSCSSCPRCLSGLKPLMVRAWREFLPQSGRSSHSCTVMVRPLSNVSVLGGPVKRELRQGLDMTGFSLRTECIRPSYTA